ncbi:ATP-dependent RNA helicase [Pseudoxanthomonas broegbernensis]|uniref:ATP-dependent RNA helicase DeaD n=1 Tax=Pseudoxanthomonas broegbernensis TaxID=83619 RepID=A0A7V8GPJ7_9GAMM|nr:DEAD/DEAH box helicase [Pseudoxanthomonas broegbernensis]KAF1687687.1 ATP-dependent RNA helicase [Pseudoxanthomonas broegbernensis]MBB6064716.1 ATP-dependent RNA helicase DeaD [Pseudoxanthomonas broegbernensis]
MSTPESETRAAPRFGDLGLPEPLLAALADVGYESPSPIQAATIPALLAGRDVLGTAQTGTGKTAAFALPVLAKLDLSRNKPQALVLAPTRELAIQVAEAFQRYAVRIPGFQVLPIYGGQGYGPQLAALRRGVQVVVGTPGRVIDHLERGSLDLSQLQCLVLDEGDEMLRMGFIDDVETVLQKTPPSRQVALFSATMPAPIRRIAQTYLKDPVEVTIAAKTTTSANIRQRYWFVSGLHKLDALTRILEAEPFDAMIVFARTKAATEELAGKLQARGVTAAAINGDMQQQQRERTIAHLKDGRLDVLVATDVAARGLDVDRISHVLNYDIPYDTESYVHRIGRTGRAGRSGEAILFVTPREKGMLRAIERATRQPIEEMRLPTVQAVNDRRVTRFFERISGALETDGLEPYRDLVDRYAGEHDVGATEIAAALARLLQGDTPLMLDASVEPEQRPHAARAPREMREPHGHGNGAPAARGPRAPRGHDDDGFAPRPPRAPKPPRAAPESGMETYRVEVGHAHGVKPGNIVGAIANEAGLESRYIGRIDIHDDHSILDLPEGMPPEVMAHLRKAWVVGQQLRISRWDGSHEPSAPAPGPRARARPPGARPGHAAKPPAKPHRKGPAKPRG